MTRRATRTSSSCASPCATPASGFPTTSRRSSSTRSPGRRLDDAPVRRHRPGPDHFRAPRGGDAGHADGRQRTGPRQRLSLRGTAACGRPIPRAHRAARRPWPDLDVLVVDDNGTNRKILVELLDAWGLRPSASWSVADALVASDPCQRRRPPGAAGPDRLAHAGRRRLRPGSRDQAGADPRRRRRADADLGRPPGRPAALQGDRRRRVSDQAGPPGGAPGAIAKALHAPPRRRRRRTGAVPAPSARARRSACRNCRAMVAACSWSRTTRRIRSWSSRS